MYKFFEKNTGRFKFKIFKFVTLVLRIPTFFSRQYTFKENFDFYKVMVGIKKLDAET